MVDVGPEELGPAAVARLIYCLGKCAYELGSPRPRGDETDAVEQNRAFLRCVAGCMAPVPLPDRDEEDDEDE